MSTITLPEAQVSLMELVRRLVPGEGVTIAENNWPVDLLIPVPIVRQCLPRLRPPVTRVPEAVQDEGRLVVPDDFKEPLMEIRQSLV